METKPKKKFNLKKFILYFLAVIFFLVAVTYIAFQVSPYPGALLIRMEFKKNGEKMNEDLAGLVPPGIKSITNLQYSANMQSDDTFLDIYFPTQIDNTSKLLPTIVWIHGGAWIAGDKSELSNYSKILSSNGYTVIQLNYSLAPGSHYPVPVKQTNEAFKFIFENHKEFHIDTSKILLAGDSGGAQIAAQLATIITSPDYSKIMNITPYLKPSSLKGVILYCGPYNMHDVNLDGAFGGFLKTVLWAYSGTKDFQNNKFFYTGSVVDYVTSSFPTAFISVGNADPLKNYSFELASKLQSLGVKTDTLFYPENYQPPLPHEYQFILNSDAGKLALQRSIAFINSVTKDSVYKNDSLTSELLKIK